MSLLARLFSLEKTLVFHRQAPPPLLELPFHPLNDKRAWIVEDYERIRRERSPNCPPVDFDAEIATLGLTDFASSYCAQRERYLARRAVVRAVNEFNEREDASLRSQRF